MAASACSRLRRPDGPNLTSRWYKKKGTPLAHRLPPTVPYSVKLGSDLCALCATSCVPPPPHALKRISPENLLTNGIFLPRSVVVGKFYGQEYFPIHAIP